MGSVKVRIGAGLRNVKRYKGGEVLIRDRRRWEAVFRAVKED
jgi:hypothetical protein